MNHPAPQSFAALVGIDWANAKHDICLQPAGSATIEHSVLTHSPEAIDAWVRELRRRFGTQPIAIALELDKGPLVYALQKYDGFVLFPINPTMLAKYREAFTPSGAKDDPTDAEFALELLGRHPEALKGLRPQSAAMRSLVQLVHDRRRLVGDKVRITNRLTNALKNYFPQPLVWFEDIDTVLFCDFLTRWPTLKQLKRARRAVLETFFHAHNVRRRAVIDQRLGAIRSALPLTEDPAIIEPQSLLVAALVAQLRTVLAAIERFNAAILATTEQLPDYAIFSSFPGAGPTFAPRLLAAFGEDRERYRRCEEYKNTPASLPSPSAAVRSPGFTGATERPPSYDRPSSSGPGKPSLDRSGPRPTTTSSAPKDSLAKRRSDPSPSSGCASCSDAGRIELRTMKPPTYSPCSAAAHRS